MNEEKIGVIAAGNFILEINQENEIITKVTINKFNDDGTALDQKIFCFTNEEFKIFILCIKYLYKNE